MPNWCSNTMEISHKDPAMLQKACDAWNEGKFLSTMVPEPDYTTTEVKKTFGEGVANPESAWWDWRVQNWGTKWDIGYHSDYDNKAVIENGSFLVFFDSAWSPPVEAYRYLEDLGFEITATYYEGGCAFVGSYANGGDECYSIPNTYEEIKAEIPDWLDNEYGISEHTLEYEVEEIMSSSNCNTINEQGILLDDQGNEYRDEQGQIVIVPEYLRAHFEELQAN